MKVALTDGWQRKIYRSVWPNIDWEKFDGSLRRHRQLFGRAIEVWVFGDGDLPGLDVRLQHYREEADPVVGERAKVEPLNKIGELSKELYDQLDRLPSELRSEVSTHLHFEAQLDIGHFERGLYRLSDKYSSLKKPLGAPRKDWRRDIAFDLGFIFRALTGREPTRINNLLNEPTGPFLDFVTCVFDQLFDGPHKLDGAMRDAVSWLGDANADGSKGKKYDSLSALYFHNKFNGLALK